MGPLKGIKAVEIGGIGPGPFAAMMLADLGAEIIRIDRADTFASREDYDWPVDYFLNRGRRSIAVDLKNPAGVEAVLRMVERADFLTEGFRPGVTERLGIGPDVCLERNPRLVYGRITGWGQQGPMANAPGHDINYVALTGILHAIGPTGGAPVPAINLLGDYGGGGMLLAFGILAALLEAKRSGQGQVVDAAMIDGAALLGTMLHGMRQMGEWTEERGDNLLDGGAPFFHVYETSDGKWVAVGSIEEKFYSALLEGLGIEESELPPQMDKAGWPATRERFAEAFRTRTRDEWCATLEPLGACFSPVLGIDEAPHHAHAQARDSFPQFDGMHQPAPAPRFSRTPGEFGLPAPAPGEHTDGGLADWGFSSAEIDELRGGGAIR
jgi:alpha-methylacyl-CoA racemase